MKDTDTLSHLLDIVSFNPLDLFHQKQPMSIRCHQKQDHVSFSAALFCTRVRLESLRHSPIQEGNYSLALAQIGGNLFENIKVDMKLSESGLKEEH